MSNCFCWFNDLDMLHQTDANELNNSTATTFAISNECCYMEPCPNMESMQTSSSSSPPTMTIANSLDSNESCYSSNDGHQDNNEFYGNINFDNLCAQYVTDNANEWEATSAEVYCCDENKQNHSQVYFQEYLQSTQQQQQQQNLSWPNCMSQLENNTQQVFQEHYTTNDNNVGDRFETSSYYQEQQQQPPLANTYPNYSFVSTTNVEPEITSVQQQNNYYQLDSMVSSTATIPQTSTETYIGEAEEEALINSLVTSDQPNVINTIDQLNDLLENATQTSSNDISQFSTDFIFDEQLEIKSKPNLEHF